jgi:hypothetical protein
MNNTTSNPLNFIISNEDYTTLAQHGLFSEKAVRDFVMKHEFKEHRKTMKADDVMEILQKQYPHLEFDTIRRIVYQKEIKPVRTKIPVVYA